MSAFGGKADIGSRGVNDCFRGKAGIIRTAGSVVLSLHHSDDLKESPRFGRAKFFRNYDRSGLYHVLGRPYCCVGAFVQVHGFEHGEGMFGNLLIVRNQQPWFG